MCADVGLAAHLFSDGEGSLEELIEHGPQTTGIAREPFGLFHLAQNLRLAQHHRIQPARHAKRMVR